MFVRADGRERSTAQPPAETAGAGYDPTGEDSGVDGFGNPLHRRQSMSTYLAQAPLPERALEEYADKWIAVRDGTVIAAADTYDELLADRAVTEDDATYRVPPASALFY
jgi:hypothetical protein